MREFTKSMMSYTWAMSLFGLQQTLNLLTPPAPRQAHPATKAFNNVAGAARDELGRTLESFYRAGDNLQRGFVDATFSVLTLGAFNRGDRSSGTSTGGVAQAASDATRATAGAFQQTVDAAQQTADVMGQALGATGQRQTRRTSQDRASDWDIPRPVNDAAS
jgi:hypothetical protein